jgi:hypothetical protein
MKLAASKASIFPQSPHTATPLAASTEKRKMEFEEGVDIEDIPQFVDPDDEFEDECCFWLMKLLRGRNTGRQLKRRIFKYAIINFLLGFPMLVITVVEGRILAPRLI